MGRPRSDLHDILVALMDPYKVYFQPPSNTLIEYPCIVYRRDNVNAQFADNVPYLQTTRYLVKYISRDPDDTLREKLAALPTCDYVRFQVVKNLNQDIYNLHF